MAPYGGQWPEDRGMLAKAWLGACKTHGPCALTLTLTLTQTLTLTLTLAPHPTPRLTPELMPTLCKAGAGGDPESQSSSVGSLEWAPDLLGRRCPLLGRKFMLAAAQSLLPVMEATAVLQPAG